MEISPIDHEIIKEFAKLSENRKRTLLVFMEVMHIKAHIDSANEQLEALMNSTKAKMVTPQEQIMQAIDNSPDPSKAADIAISTITKYILNNNLMPKDELMQLVSENANTNPLNEKEIELLTSDKAQWKEQEWTEFPTFDAVDVNGGNDGGYIYAAEYGDYIKIGYTIAPRSRLNTHAATAKNYGNITTGRVLLSPAHRGYQKTEKLLHEYFKEYRKSGTELFEIAFDELKARVRAAIAEG